MVTGTLWLTTLIALFAFGLDTYLIATAKLHQSSTVESIALGTLRTLRDPPPDIQPLQGASDVDRYNFAIDRGGLLGASTVLSGVSPQLPSPSLLHVRVSSRSDDAGEGCGDDGVGGGGEEDPGNGNGEDGPGDCGGVVSGSCDDGNGGGTDVWCGFEGTSPVGSAIFGTFQPDTKTFTPASTGGINTVNAVKVRLKLGDTSNSPLVLPMIGFLTPGGKVSFESTAIVHRDQAGRYRVVQE